jgi:hypothetical protein
MKPWRYRSLSLIPVRLGTRVLCLLLAPWLGNGYAAQHPALAQNPAGYAPAESCLVCHTEQAKAWKSSDHDWAMAVGTP